MEDYLLKLKPISIKEIDISSIILSKCGGHTKDSLKETIEKKSKDLYNCTFCLWAHGNLNPKHTRRFCDEMVKKGKDIYVIMPITRFNSTGSSKKTVFKSYYDGKTMKTMPQNMEEVNGGPRSNRAFYFNALFRLEESADLKKYGIIIML